MKFGQKHYFKAVSILCLLVLVGAMSITHAQAEKAVQTDQSLWRSIKQRAEKAGDRKALWRELKKLEPKQLLKAGEQFCQQEPVEQDPFSHVMTVNAILSYHQDKTSYHETARVVSDIVRNSNNVPWIYGALKWPVINEHWRMIPGEDIDDIGIAMAQRLEDNQAPQKIHLLVSKLCTEDEFYMNWSEDTLKRIYGAMKKRQNALKEQGENAKSTRSRLKKCIAQLKPLVESDRFKRVDVQLNASGRLWPDAVTCLAKALFRYGQQSRDMRGQAVDILAKLKGRNSVPEACKILFKEYEKEPNEEIRNKMVEPLETIDPELEETKRQAEMHSWIKTKELWKELAIE